jgi:LicD family protein
MRVLERAYLALGGSAAPLPGRPCSPETARCDYWNWGPEATRPACCTAQLINLAAFAHELLERHQIVHWLEFGSLLGAVRDGHLIPWDADVDFGIYAADVDRVLSLRPEIERAGYVLAGSPQRVMRIQLSPRNNLHVDLFPCVVRDGMVEPLYSRIFGDDRERAASGGEWPGTAGRQAFPGHFLEQPAPVALEGLDLPAPVPAELFLRDHRYGDDFRIPVRSAIDLGLVPPIRPGELTPPRKALLDLVRRREAELVALERPRAGRLGSLDAWDFWVRSAVPSVPAAERVERLAAELHVSADDLIAGPLLGWAARFEQAIDERTRPTVRLPIVRGGRRARAVFRRVSRAIRLRSLRG